MTGFLAGVVFTLLVEGVFLVAVWLDRRDSRLEQTGPAEVGGVEGACGETAAQALVQAENGQTGQEVGLTASRGASTLYDWALTEPGAVYQASGPWTGPPPGREREPEGNPGLGPGSVSVYDWAAANA